ncbi:type III-B CRISPR module RAMP protein Cmr6 [Gynuella sunshinyii]|uniref:Uncharacterized protein predicted to be involved in DNA repair (RAMP superfamily) n=1 Tax=Gynuella sunshinyii YC6258 TaxID=1445510 RepID=A0A0C5VSD9_9GAMM|nr:type III-B CRISPR module RAMP protein Cmr6 [Gynuella sunshinyii]AJQ93189.1 uncharacterized protein predicted to be involved in DNA repair (RAMP superfamily) [Gynuella sunshinyii YC6258]
MTEVFPLYQQANKIPKQRQSTHAGLYFDRFYNLNEAQSDQKSRKDESPETRKSGFLKEIERMSGESKCGNPSELRAYQDRHLNLLIALNGVARVYRSDWHWVSGLGLPNPVENGFLWHPTLATPYLSGAAVKGLVRAWIEQDAAETKEKKQLLKKLFGSDTKQTTEQQTGDIIFFDAFPIEPVELTVDTITPHYSDWYSNGNNATIDNPETVPADWNTTQPIPFLAIKQSKLMFSFAARPGISLSEQERLLIKTALDDALQWLGAGAKTAVGYGYMSEDLNETNRLGKERRKREEELRKREEERRKREEALLRPAEKTLKWLQNALNHRLDNGIQPNPSDELRQKLAEAIKKAEESDEWLSTEVEMLVALADRCIEYWGGCKGNKKLTTLQTSAHQLLEKHSC